MMMAPEWMGSEGTWFVALNAVVVAIAFLSRARPSLASPRNGGITRRASSAVLQRLRSFSIFSYPSGCHSFLQPDAATSQDTQEPPLVVTSPMSESPTPLPSPQPAAAEEEKEGDPNAMSMDEVYALVLASRQRPEREREEEARRSEEGFIQGFNDEQRQQRLNSIFNYTQMLKQRALGRGHR